MIMKFFTMLLLTINLSCQKDLASDEKKDFDAAIAQLKDISDDTSPVTEEEKLLAKPLEPKHSFKQKSVSMICEVIEGKAHCHEKKQSSSWLKAFQDTMSISPLGLNYRF